MIKKLVFVIILLISMLLCSCSGNLSDSFSQHLEEGVADSSSEAFPLSDSEYDELLASGDGYYLVSLFSETYNSASTAYGVVDQNGDWVCPLSDSNAFAAAVEDVLSDGYNEAYSKPEFAYLGSGIFVVKVRCVIVGKESIPSGYWDDWGFHGCCCLVDCRGNACGNGGFMITEIYDGC